MRREPAAPPAPPAPPGERPNQPNGFEAVGTRPHVHGTVGDATRARVTPHRSPVSVGWVVGASLLMGVGIFAITLWLITFDWVYFGGILPMAVGILMMFDPRAGANGSE